jgi:hypothetical protein
MSVTFSTLIHTSSAPFALTNAYGDIGGAEGAASTTETEMGSMVKTSTDS